MAFNSSIPLSARGPNVLENIARATAMAGTANEVQRMNQLAQVQQEHGAGILSGDRNSLNALAGVDVQGAMNIQAQQQNMSIQREKLSMARQAAARAAAGQAAQLDAAQAANEAAQLERAVAGALGAGSQEQLDGFLRSVAPDLVGTITMENRDMYAAQALGVKDALEMAGGGRATEADREIQRLMSIGWSREDAIKLKEGAIRVVTDPVTRETTIIDMQTGQPVRGVAPEPEAATQPSAQPVGDQFQNAGDAFGVGGAARRAVNTIADATVGATPFPDTRQAQSDFAVFGESLINAFASAYGRQPPSWLLRNIESLTPRPGVLEGPGAAQDKLRSMARDLESRRAGMVRSASRKQSPNSKQDTEAQILGVDATLEQIYRALAGFDGGGASGTTSSGIQWSIEP